MAYNRYYGNSGRREFVPTEAHRHQSRGQEHRPQPEPERSPPMQRAPGGHQTRDTAQHQTRHGGGPPMSGHRRPPAEKRPPSPFAGLGESIGGLLGKLKLHELELEDMLLLMILYLLYRESGDKELLIIMGAMYLL